jgi:hypothetical protein
VFMTPKVTLVGRERHNSGEGQQRYEDNESGI